MIISILNNTILTITQSLVKSTKLINSNNVNFNGDMRIPYEIGCKMQKKRIECAIALKAEEMNK